MNSLKEIKVEDIRKGQTVLAISSVISEIFVAAADGGNGLGYERFFLFSDSTSPPNFEVPWGTTQRDSLGDIWKFFDKESPTGNVAFSAGSHWPRGVAAQYAPFTRLHTVQELTDAIERVAGKPTQVSRELLHMQEVGDI